MSAIVAIVGDDELLLGALQRALRSRGASTITFNVETLLSNPPPHDLCLLIGEPALDGGAAVLGLMRSSRERVAVVLRDAALAERLNAHRRGARVILRRDSVDAMAEDVARALKGGDKSELGWTSLSSIVDMLTQSIGVRLSVDATVRTELFLGDPEAVAEAIERCADELGMLAFQARAGEVGPTVTVDELGWDDDPQTAQQSAADMERWRRLAARAHGAAQTSSSPSMPATDLADLLEPDELLPPRVREPEEVTKPAALLPPVLEPDLVAPTPAAARHAELPTPPLVVPPPGSPQIATVTASSSRGTPWLAIGIGVAALVGIGVAGLSVISALDAGRERSTRTELPEETVPMAQAPVAVEPAPADAPAPSNEADARERADELVDRAAAHEREGRWDAARTTWERALAADPVNPHAFAGLARERIQAGDAAAAIRYAERASQLRRRRASYRVLLGDAHRLAGHAEEARRHYEAALLIDPDDSDARARVAE